MSAFPGSEFKTKQLTVQTVPGLPCFLTGNIEHTSVVTGKNDERIFSDFQLIQSLEQLAHNPVKFMNEITIQTALTCSLELGIRSERMVNIGGCKIKEEGLIVVFLMLRGYPIDRFLGKNCTDILVPVAQMSFPRSTNGSIAPFLGPFLGNGLLTKNKWILRIVIHNTMVFDINERRSAVHRRHAEVVIEPNFQRAGFQGFIPVRPALTEPQVPLPND